MRSARDGGEELIEDAELRRDRYLDKNLLWREHLDGAALSSTVGVSVGHALRVIRRGVCVRTLRPQKPKQVHTRPVLANVAHRAARDGDVARRRVRRVLRKVESARWDAVESGQPHAAEHLMALDKQRACHRNTQRE